MAAPADTIEGMSKIVGMNPETIKNTVARCNEFVKVGKDANFGRPKAFMTKPISEGPYWVVEQKSRFATSLGGTKVSGRLEVLDSQGWIIPNLYAAGEVVGGVRGIDSAAGANIGWAIRSGKFAAEEISRHLKQ